jgi:hypothetical protein
MPPEVDLHSGLGQPHHPFVPLDATPADQRRHRRDRVGIRELRGTCPKVPDTTQNAGRQVEAPAAQAIALVGVGEQRRGFGIDGDRRATRGAVDPGREAVVAVPGVLRLDAVYVGNRGRGGARCVHLVVGPEQELVLRGHCSKQSA